MFIGREEECLLTLAKLRNMAPESAAVQYEFRALQAERLVEREAAKERYGIDCSPPSLCSTVSCSVLRPRRSSSGLGESTLSLK
jgi:hypothetical protein